MIINRRAEAQQICFLFDLKRVGGAVRQQQQFLSHRNWNSPAFAFRRYCLMSHPFSPLLIYYTHSTAGNISTLIYNKPRLMRTNGRAA